MAGQQSRVISRDSSHKHTAGAVSAAALANGRVVAVRLGGAAGRALGVGSATGLRARVAITALSLLRLVAVGVAATEAHSKHGHHGQAVRLGLGADSSGGGQNGNRSGGSEKHLDAVRESRIGQVVAVGRTGLFV